MDFCFGGIKEENLIEKERDRSTTGWRIRNPQQRQLGIEIDKLGVFKNSLSVEREVNCDDISTF